VYIIEIVFGNNEQAVVIQKRYNEFFKLNKALKKVHRFSNLPKLPKKKWFGNTDPDFVQRRFRKLEFYLNSLKSIEGVFETKEMIHFLVGHSTDEDSGSDEEPTNQQQKQNEK
jgi:hypothetical protein